MNSSSTCILPIIFNYHLEQCNVSTFGINFDFFLYQISSNLDEHESHISCTVKEININDNDSIQSIFLNHIHFKLEMKIYFIDLQFFKLKVKEYI